MSTFRNCIRMWFDKSNVTSVLRYALIYLFAICCLSAGFDSTCKRYFLDWFYSILVWALCPRHMHCHITGKWSGWFVWAVRIPQKYMEILNSLENYNWAYYTIDTISILHKPIDPIDGKRMLFVVKMHIERAPKGFHSFYFYIMSVYMNELWFHELHRFLKLVMKFSRRASEKSFRDTATA